MTFLCDISTMKYDLRVYSTSISLREISLRHLLYTNFFEEMWLREKLHIHFYRENWLRDLSSHPFLRRNVTFESTLQSISSLLSYQHTFHSCIIQSDLACLSMSTHQLHSLFIIKILCECILRWGFLSVVRSTTNHCNLHATFFL